MKFALLHELFSKKLQSIANTEQNIFKMEKVRNLEKSNYKDLLRPMRKDNLQ